MKEIRIDKYISVSYAVSRNDAKGLIKKREVAVNDITVTSSDFKVKEGDSVTVKGKPMVYKEFVYIVMNKPKGVLSASNDKNAKTVIDLVSSEFSHYDLFPVGRLDKDTTGLLIITNDGDFAHKVISPKSNTDKRYLVNLDGDITDQHISLFAEGVILADGTRCLPAKLSRISNCVAEITIREGKYHQVKRMFGVVGLGVNHLKRLSIGKFDLPIELSEGESREMIKEELSLVIS